MTGIIEEYGAVNISLINDLPLFIDPFYYLIVKIQILKIHKEMINYLLFYNSSQMACEIDFRNEKCLVFFSEIKQTWLGFSLSGNSGCGMGNDFANNLYRRIKFYF